MGFESSYEAKEMKISFHFVKASHNNKFSQRMIYKIYLQFKIFSTKIPSTKTY